MSRRQCITMMVPVFALSGCGFRPIYSQQQGGNAGGPVREALAAIQVAIIPNRTGQVLRQDLQERFEGQGTGIARRYDLYVAYSVGSEGISIQPDSSVTRTRLVGTASWNLLAQDPTRSSVTSGVARSVDGIDVINEQFFAADLDVEAAQRRISAAIADQITLQIAAYFRRQSNG
jgi:LPS-assembly lipoprotein